MAYGDTDRTVHLVRLLVFLVVVVLVWFIRPRTLHFPHSIGTGAIWITAAHLVCAWMAFEFQISVFRMDALTLHWGYVGVFGVMISNLVSVSR